MTAAMTPARATAALFLSLTLLTGCANLPVASDIKSKARSGHGLIVFALRVSRTSGGLQVVGSMVRGAYYTGFARIHLDIEVLSPEGRRLALAPTRFFPNPLSYQRTMRSHAEYVQTVPGDFPPGSQVQVTVHDKSLRNCTNAAFTPL